MKKPFKNGRNAGIDLTMHLDGGDFLHIRGNNDWGLLFVDAIQPLLDYGESIIRNIENRLSEYRGKPELIALGRNEYRAIDVLHRLKGFGEPIKIYKGIPVVKINADNKIELFGFVEDSELPF